MKCHPRKRWIPLLSMQVLAPLALAASTTWAFEPVVLETMPLQDPTTKGALTDGLSEPAEASEQATPSSQPPEPVSASALPYNYCNQLCCTAKQREAATAAMKGAFKGLFYANDFSYLNNPCYTGPSFLGEGLKGLCCDRLDIGGEVRVRYHNERNHRGLGLTGRDDNFWLTRYRMYADYQMNDYLRVYGEYLYADSAGETFASRPIEENRGEMQNLFVDTLLTENLTLRLGRQELLYGNQRLISPLDWANTRRTFDGGRFLYSGDVWNVDGFFTHPLNRRTSQIDDPNEDVDFYGLYATRDDLSIGTVDTYYIALDDSTRNFDFHTLGTRVAGKTDGGLLYEFEGGVQFGENSDGTDHDAGFFTSGLGRQLNICTHCGPWKPTIWLWYDWASGGDDPNAAVGDDSFHHYFPLAHKYLGFMDLFGRRNINDVNAQFITPVLGSRVTMLLWYHYFFLDERTTPYNVNMTPYNAGNVAGDRELGHEIDLLFTVAINPRNSALIGYSYFNAGDYYDSTAGIPNAAPPRADNDAQFFYTQYQMRF